VLNDIKLRSVVLLLSLLAVAIIIPAAIDLAGLRSLFRAGTVARLEVVSTVEAAALGAPIYNFDAATIGSLCRALALDPSYGGVRVVDGDGRALFEDGKVADQPGFVTRRVDIKFSSGPGEAPRKVGTLEMAIDLQSVEAAWRDSAWMRVCETVLVLLLVGIGIYAVLNALTRPIIGLTQAMGILAAGDTAVEIPARARADEVGAMAVAVQVFKDKMIHGDQLAVEKRADQERKEKRQVAIEGFITSFEGDVRGSLGTLTLAANEMRATSQAMSATAEATSAQATTVAAAAEQASANVQTVSAATEELSSSVAEISRQVSQSSRIAGQAVNEADHTNATVRGLSAAAQKIGDVVKLISDIASQTNLLALNATIEAARAGDAGKGFAVVASEVKSLANQTARATEEISAQVAAMQSATSEAVEAIKSIGATIGAINEIATTIASTVEEQGAATQEIARNVQEAAQGTGQVSSNIVSVNQAAAETGAASSQVLASAEELGKQAETLRADVSKFLANIRAA
jgi:methyl-accepting chemotaxis protein